MLLSGRYDLKEVIGSGGMGRVYLAVDLKLHKKWAVKELDFTEEEISQKCFDAEIMALKRLDHRCLPRIVDVISEGKKSYIVMDLIQGRNLKSLADKALGLPEKEVLEIGIKLSDVLEYLHTRKNPVIYRDLKPSNVIIRPDGEIALVDFGASVLLSKSKADYAIGTRHFAAPEQYCSVADERSDIYALGKTLRYILGEQKCSIIFESILIKCVQEEPNNRYQSAKELGNELKRLRNSKSRRIWIFLAVVISAFWVFVFKKDGETHTTMEEQNISVSDSVIDDSEAKSSNAISQEADISAVARAKELHIKARELVSKENKDSVSLGKALQLLEEEKEVLGAIDSDELREYRIENLSMLATIYRLLGRKNHAFRDKYYEKAEDCIVNLFNIDKVKETSLYRMKLADLVVMKEEVGDEEEAMRLLKEWEEEHPEDGIELYFYHLCMLLKKEGNEAEVERLFKSICLIPGARDDFRFEEIESQVMKYLKED